MHSVEKYILELERLREFLSNSFVILTSVLVFRK